MPLLDRIKSEKPFRPWDIAVAVVFIAVLVVCLVGFSAPKGETLNVYVDGRLYATYSLDTDREIVIMEGDVAMTVTVKDGSVFVKESNCKNHICENGNISRGGQSIICLPNGVVLKIVGESEVDGVSR